MKSFLKKKGEKKEKTLTKVKNWYQDRYETVVIQRNILLIFVACFIVVFGLTIIGIIGLNSTKVYEPFIVQIEDNTGVITKVNNSKVRELPAEKAIRNSSLVRYVIARESYNYADYTFNYYQIVRLMSSGSVYSQFSSLINPTSPFSPISMGFDSKIDVKIKSIIELDESNNVIQVRIDKAKLPGAATFNEDAFKKAAKSYIITLRYEYKDLDLSETERYINPLGMQITAYSIVEEINAINN